MALFQKSVLNKYLKQQDDVAVEKAYKKVVKYFFNPITQQNIRDINEEGFQQKFLMELFATCFGYVINPDPDYNLTTEFKNLKDAKKADGAILVDGKAIGVIELKGTNTKNLEKCRQQAFDYKSNHPTCIYVITSNFEKLRFYINTSDEFEEFNLFTLTETRFALLYLCVFKENLLSNTPLKIKEASIQEEEAITKKFYNNYSTFKRELFRDLVKLNMTNEVFRAELSIEDSERANKNIKQNLFKKSQKLIDRFLFVFFGEDRGLLPPNSTLAILKKWQDDVSFGDVKPLYNIFKIYFNVLDQGRAGVNGKAEIFAYNGGLFKPDPVLDSLIISDELLYKHTKDLSHYDFDSQVDVNILGHIFENSLNEIESVNAEIEGGEFDKQTSKRKKDGVFYTPKYITKYIVDNTVGRLCTEKKAELGVIEEEYFKSRKGRHLATLEPLRDNLEAYRQWLLHITILDPACGSGAFLNQALDFLIKEHQYIDELQTNLSGGGFVFPDIENTVLENNIFGVDINEESVEIAKLSLWLRTAQPRRKLNNLSNNIKCGNSLIDDPSVAGDIAFKWEEEFPEIFNNGGFDVVIGNPPYVSSKGESFDENDKAFLTRTYNTAVYQIDLYMLFLEKGVQLISDDGLTSFIVPNTWLNNLNLKSVRRFMLENTSMKEIVSMPSGTFASASVDTVIVTYSSGAMNDRVHLLRYDRSEFDSIGYASQKEWADDKGAVINVFLDQSSGKLLKRVEASSIPVGSFCEAVRGVGIYHKRKGHTKEFIASDPFQSAQKGDDTFVPYLRGKNLQRWHLTWNEDSFLSYGEWLAEPREPRFFEGKRILIRKILSERINTALIEKQFIVDQQVYTVKIDKPTGFSLEALFALLSSSLITYYFRLKYSEFDDLFPQIKLDHIKSLPISKRLSEISDDLTQLVESGLAYVSQFYLSRDSLLMLLHSKFSIDSPSKKLQSWPELDFNNFLEELKKKKVKFSLEDEAEWLQYFNKKKAEANARQTEIDNTYKEIDALVYKLYGLSKEEIKIVEEG